MCCFIFGNCLPMYIQKQKLILIFSNLLEAFVYIVFIYIYTVKPAKLCHQYHRSRHLHIAPSKGVFVSLGNMKMSVENKRQP